MSGTDAPMISAQQALAVPVSAYKLRHIDCPHMSEWSKRMGLICLNCALIAFGKTNEDFEDWLG